MWLNLPGRPRLLALLAGLLIGLAQPPFGILPGLLGYPLLLWALERDLGRNPNRTAYFMGWLAGFSYFFVSCFWVAEAFLVDAETYGWMAPFAATLLPAGIALFWGAFAVLYRKLAPSGQRRFVLFATLFSAFEMARGMVLSGFPWDPSGATWKAGGAMSQVAAYVGVYGLGFITVLIFTSVAAIRRDRGPKGWWPLAAGVSLWLACFAIGEVRLANAHITQTGLTVRLVQPAIGQKAKWTNGAFDQIFSAYTEMTAAPPRPGHAVPQVVIWPEGALPVMAEDLFANDSWTAPVMTRILRDNQSLIMGVSRGERDKAGRNVWRNSMLILHQSRENLYVEGAYNKYKLVPFGEFTPFASILNPLGLKALTHFDDSFTPGERTHSVQYGNIPRFLPLICYEGIFPSLDMTSYTSSNDAQRPHWIVNISNDAWFGPTTGPIQHLNLASYRAIEEGLPMVRSTPTGISVLVDPYGRVVQGSRLDLGRRGYIDLTIPERAPLTSYSKSRFGIFIFLLFSLLIFTPFNILLRVIKKNQARDATG